MSDRRGGDDGNLGFPAEWVEMITRDDEACILLAIMDENHCTDAVCVNPGEGNCICKQRFDEVCRGR